MLSIVTLISSLTALMASLRFVQLAMYARNANLTGMNAERDAMGADEYHPISHRGSNFSIHGGVGYMVIDAIDTMYLMGLKEEYNRARLWLATEHTFDRNGNFNSFEARRFLCPQVNC